MLRALLITGCVGAAALAATFGTPEAYLQADAALGRLLRGMALLKGVLVFAALAVLWWRFGSVLAKATATLYLIGAWTVCAATVLVWQLTWIAPAAAAFHVAAFVLLVVGWRDGMRSALSQPAKP